MHFGKEMEEEKAMRSYSQLANLILKFWSNIYNS